MKDFSNLDLATNKFASPLSVNKHECVDLITNRDILLVCENFYDYDTAIRDELLRIGAKSVSLKNSQYFYGSPLDCETLHDWLHFPQNYLRHPIARSRWTRKFADETKDRHFDVLLVIENTSFKKWFISYLKKKNPEIKAILFLWDTFATQQKHHRSYLPLFDKVYTFDRDDAKKYNLKYFPDWYINSKTSVANVYDVCFIGTANSSATIHRIALTHKLKNICDNQKLSSFFYVKYHNFTSRNPMKKIHRKLFPKRYERLIKKYIGEGFLHDESLSLDKVNAVLMSSRIIVDINHRNRQGMTLNVIMALAYGKKLITTNKRIKEEAFYNENNICIIDEENPLIPGQFWHSPPHKIDFSYLRLDNWLRHIINS